MKENLIEVFDKLSTPPLDKGRGLLSAMQISGKEWRLSKDIEGRPGLLLPTVSGSAPAASYALQHLRIDGSLQCRIMAEGDQIATGDFTAIYCLSSDREIQEYFLRVADMLITSLPLDAGSSDVTTAIEKLVALFRALSQPSRKSVAGLWGELFLIVKAKDPFALLKAWHIESNEEVDFSEGRSRLEVKCSADGTRRHYFSLEQLTPPSGSTQVVASMLLETAAGGKSVRELWGAARELASGDVDLLYKIEKSCAAALGPDWQDSVDWKYDEQRAADSLKFFSAEGIPMVSADLPRGVSDVRFRSDLNLAQNLSLKELDEKGVLFGSAIPSS